MTHGLPALGIALVTLAGGVWYVPALADLRAGTDRPVSRRSAAAACLTGWGTCAAVAVLLLAGAVWQAAWVLRRWRARPERSYCGCVPPPKDGLREGRRPGTGRPCGLPRPGRTTPGTPSPRSCSAVRPPS